VLVEKDGAERLYFVAETKGSLHAIDLREKEHAKKECGRPHFAALTEGEPNPANFVTATSLADVLAHTM
jgi:type III restriction enzyme